jgi:hypothetical protein
LEASLQGGDLLLVDVSSLLAFKCHPINGLCLSRQGGQARIDLFDALRQDRLRGGDFLSDPLQRLLSSRRRALQQHLKLPSLQAEGFRQLSSLRREELDHLFDDLALLGQDCFQLVQAGTYLLPLGREVSRQISAQVVVVLVNQSDDGLLLAALQQQESTQFCDVAGKGFMQASPLTVSVGLLLPEGLLEVAL